MRPSARSLSKVLHSGRANERETCRRGRWDCISYVWAVVWAIHGQVAAACPASCQCACMRVAERLNNQAPRLTWSWMRERASPQPYLQSSSSSMACLLRPSLPLSSSAISACADRHGPDKCCMAACAAAPHAAALPLHLSLLWRGLSQCILVRPVGPEPPLEALSRDPQPTVVAWHVVRDERRREFLCQH